MPKKDNYCILIHYSEIALKLNNRIYFERLFINNIKTHLKDLPYDKILHQAARVVIENIDIKQKTIYLDRLKHTMGLQNATIMLKVKPNIDEVKSAIENIVIHDKFDTFRITTKRQNKKFEHTSPEVNIIIGDFIRKKFNKKVNLNNADINFIIEILDYSIYVGCEMITGFSGLPARCQEQALSLISSGIDSPVSSFEMIKRGVKVDYIHFHSYPAINKQSIDNVKKLLNILNQYQLKSKLFLVPLLEIQQKIMATIPDKYWVIFFRRLMIHISNIIGNKINAIALITGDSVGQVASQTLSNIRAVSNASDLPILRPLSGMNKNDIVNRAKIIGTYETSILPYEDCCSFFVPPHPETKAKMSDILLLDKKMDLNDLITDTINKTETLTLNFME